MIIYIIVAKHPDEAEPWILAAWDEYTVNDNYEGFEEDIRKHTKKNKGCEVRTAEVEVEDDFFSKIFAPYRTKATRGSR